MTPPIEQPSRSPVSPAVVLHVDDDARFGDLTATYLEKLADDITVLPETNPRNALERLSSERTDCIVSDYDMPRMDGIEFLKSVREKYPNLPFFLFTGKGSQDVASNAIDAGVTSYIQKDGTEAFEQLANRIHNALDHRLSEIARDQLLTLYEQSAGYYILDPEWTIIHWNFQFAERTGILSDDVLGENFWDVFPEAVETTVHDEFHHAMEANEPTEFEIEDTLLGYWAEIRANPVEYGLFVYSRDITEKREREGELDRRNHILESFASTVSHDLRNPLSVAEGKLQLAKETGDFDHLEGVTEAHDRMRNLIAKLLRSARDEELSVSSVSIAEVAQMAWKTVPAESAKLVVQGDMTFEAHESQLRQLFENLFWNAIEHGQATEIRVGRLDDKGVYVEDDGAGIPPSQRESVFESGFSTEEENPGYGLSIVQGVIELHDWEIAVTEAEDGGARFNITGIEFTG